MKYIISALCFLPSIASAVTLTANYVLPLAREDGTAVKAGEITNCRLYDVTKVDPVKVADMGVTGSYSFQTTEVGEKKYAADCVDKNGLASKLSKVVTVVLDSSSLPNAPAIEIKLIYTIKP